MSRVLVVDNEQDIADVLKKGLERNGLEADVAYGPDTALKKFGERRYDLVLLDIMMPKMDGYELYSRMLEIDPGVKACFMTAYDVPYLEVLKQGPIYNQMVSIVRKPVSMSELMRVLRLDLAVA